MTSAWQPHQFPPDEGAEVAFAGRSNAGKSSALNAITGRKDLARTSKTPGRTQLINFFALDGAQRLADLPGYGYAKVPEHIKAHWQELLRRYVEARASLGAGHRHGLAPAADRFRPADARVEPGQRPCGAPAADQGRQAEPGRGERGAQAGARGRSKASRPPSCFRLSRRPASTEARREVLETARGVTTKKSPVTRRAIGAVSPGMGMDRVNRSLREVSGRERPGRRS